MGGFGETRVPSSDEVEGPYTMTRGDKIGWAIFLGIPIGLALMAFLLLVVR